MTGYIKSLRIAEYGVDEDGGLNQKWNPGHANDDFWYAGHTTRDAEIFGEGSVLTHWCYMCRACCC